MFHNVEKLFSKTAKHWLGKHNKATIPYRQASDMLSLPLQLCYFDCFPLQLICLKSLLIQTANRTPVRNDPSLRLIFFKAFQQHTPSMECDKQEVVLLLGLYGR